MYMYLPCLNFQNWYFAYYKVGHVLVNIEPIFMLFVTISSCVGVLRPIVTCKSFFLTGPYACKKQRRRRNNFKMK